MVFITMRRRGRRDLRSGRGGRSMVFPVGLASCEGRLARGSGCCGFVVPGTVVSVARPIDLVMHFIKVRLPCIAVRHRCEANRVECPATIPPRRRSRRPRRRILMKTIADQRRSFKPTSLSRCTSAENVLRHRRPGNELPGPPVSFYHSASQYPTLHPIR